MPQDALHYRILAKELDKSLRGGRIEKIVALSPDTLRFSVKNFKVLHHLIISSSASRTRCHLTSTVGTVMEKPPSFVSHCKRHLAGGRVLDVSSILGERVICIKVGTTNDLGDRKSFLLYCELMGKHSNVILVNDENKITDSLRHVPLDISSKRQVLPGLPYTPPPTQNKTDPYDQISIKAVLEGFKGLNLDEYLLDNLQGLSSTTIDEIIFNVFDDEIPDKLSAKDVEKLGIEIANILDEAKLSPCVRIFEDKKAGFFIKPYLSLVGEYQSTNSLNEAADLYFTFVETHTVLNELERKFFTLVNGKVKKVEKKLGALITKKQSAESFEDEQIKGEILTANLYRLKKGDTECVADNYYIDPPTSITIPLDTQKSPSQNAQEFFKKAQKKKRTIENITPQIFEAESELEYLDSLLLSLKTAESIEDYLEIREELKQNGLIKVKAANDKNKKGKSAEKENCLGSVKKTEFEGYVILTGKTNTQNDALLKSAAPNDVWLHTKDIHGAHTIIVNPKKTLPNENIIKRAAARTARYSKAALSENVPVDYTFAKFVHKHRGATPGKVIYTNQKTVYVTPEGG